MIWFNIRVARSKYIKHVVNIVFNSVGCKRLSLAKPLIILSWLRSYCLFLPFTTHEDDTFIFQYQYFAFIILLWLIYLNPPKLFYWSHLLPIKCFAKYFNNRITLNMQIGRQDFIDLPPCRASSTLLFFYIDGVNRCVCVFVCVCVCFCVYIDALRHSKWRSADFKPT